MDFSKITRMHLYYTTRKVTNFARCHIATLSNAQL